MTLCRSPKPAIAMILLTLLSCLSCSRQSSAERANPTVVTISTDTTKNQWRLKDFQFFVRLNYPELSKQPTGAVALTIFEAFKRDLILQVISQAYGIRVGNDDINRFAKEHLTRLGYNEMNEEERLLWREEVKRRMAIRELLQRKILKQDQVAEEAISSFYEQNEADYKHDQEFLVRFVQTASKATAEQFIAQLKLGTKTFTDLGKDYAVNGGHQFAVPMRADELGTPFGHAVANMRPGGYSQPIPVSHGDQVNFYVLYLESVIPETQENFEDAYHAISEELHRRHCRKALKRMLDEFNRSPRFKIEIHAKNLPFDYNEESQRKEV